MNEVMAWDVVVMGGANTDYLVRGERLPGPGETVQGETFQEAAGGKGANQAVAAARLGARVAFIACVGDDPRGEQLVTALAAEGVDTRFVRRDNTAVSGVALIQVGSGGQKQIFVAPGANSRLNVSDVLAATPAIAHARILISQLEVPVPPILAALRLAREAGVPVILDAAPPTELPDELLGLVNIVRANLAEAQALTGVHVHDQESARQAIADLQARGAEAGIVQGGSGNLLVGSDEETWLPLLEVETLDTTGAGDAFVGALAVAMAEGQPLAEAADFANVAAALATTKLGAQPSLPYRQDIEAYVSGRA